MTPRFSLVELVVQDMARSLAFYRRLGLDIPADADREEHVHTSLSGDVSIAWDTREVIRSFDPSWTPPSGGHGVGVAFACDSPADVDSTYADLVAAGHDGHLKPWDAFWGMRYAVVHDPDGNSVDLYAPLPSGEAS